MMKLLVTSMEVPMNYYMLDSLVNILGFVVKEQYRYLGVGSMLIEKLEFWAKENAFYGIRLVSGYERSNAHKFYEKHGFVNRKNKKTILR